MKVYVTWRTTYQGQVLRGGPIIIISFSKQPNNSTSRRLTNIQSYALSIKKKNSLKIHIMPIILYNRKSKKKRKLVNILFQ